MTANHITTCRRTHPLRYGLALGLLSAAGCGTIAAKNLNSQGVQLFQQAQYREAANQFQQAITADPSNADGYYNLAAAYHRIGKMEHRQTDLELAERTYRTCLDHNPEHRDCYRGLSVLLVEQNRSNEAFRLLESWGDRFPTSAEPKIELARLMGEFGDKKSSQDQLTRALALDPNNARAWAALGKLREELGDRGQALTDYQRSLALNHFQPEVSARVASLSTLTAATAPPTPPDQAPVRLSDRDQMPRR